MKASIITSKRANGPKRKPRKNHPHPERPDRDAMIADRMPNESHKMINSIVSRIFRIFSPIVLFASVMLLSLNQYKLFVKRFFYNSTNFFLPYNIPFSL